jgi:TetR/AcrR family transcriptional regulator, regulator of cefoperazone and chloramphenicol sensitivity
LRNFASSTAARTETRQRLLEAAGEVFVERGFRTATIREICRRARANLAAVNYHFGDKEHLYTAVLEYALGSALDKYPFLALGDGSGMPATSRLEAHIRYLLLSLFDDGAPAWLGKLVAREMVEPTRALDALVTSIITPMGQRLGAMVREILGDGATDVLVARCQMSIIAQCLHYRNARPVIQRLFPQERYEPADIAAMADHIARFSLTALAGLAASGADGGDGPVSQELPE